MGRMGNPYRILIGKLERKGATSRPYCTILKTQGAEVQTFSSGLA
jgi:hypothetical protein